MAGLQGKVKNALDEARMLVLGAQVLLGFQYRGFFEKTYDELSPVERALKMAALFALLATIGALFLIASRHRIVEQGRDSARFHRFTKAVMQVVLLPFALALGFDLAIAGNRIGGAATGAAGGALTLAAALALWYGPFALRGRRIAEEAEDAMEDTPLQHRIVEVLTEARVLLPGAQALLGFQLAIVLMETFAKLPRDAQLVDRLAIPPLRRVKDVTAIEGIAQHLFDHERIALAALVEKIPELVTDVGLFENRADDVGNALRHQRLELNHLDLA